MDKATFKNIAYDGDLIIVIVVNKGKYVDRFNKNTAHIGVYSDNSDREFNLSSVVDIINTKPVDTYHTVLYDNVESVTVIKCVHGMHGMYSRIVKDVITNDSQ